VASVTSPATSTVVAAVVAATPILILGGKRMPEKAEGNDDPSRIQTRISENGVESAR
jgi:hypothetical protein